MICKRFRMGVRAKTFLKKRFGKFFAKKTYRKILRKKTQDALVFISDFGFGDLLYCLAYVKAIKYSTPPIKSY